MTCLLCSDKLRHISLVQEVYVMKTDRKLTGNINTRNLALASEKELLSNCQVHFLLYKCISQAHLWMTSVEKVHQLL